jgi:uncharacterized protein YbaR (Trm112 family)
LELRGEYLVCLQCRRAYPIREDIPVLLVEEAVPWEQVEARMPNLPAEP